MRAEEGTYFTSNIGLDLIVMCRLDDEECTPETKINVRGVNRETLYIILT